MAQPRKKTATAPPEQLVLARAAHSGDPAVHQLLAELQTAQLNGDDARVAELNEQLADLGYC